MHLIVINPNEEMGQATLRLPVLVSHFNNAGIEHEVHIAAKAKEAYEKTLNFCRKHPDCKGVIGIGGDGVLQEVAAGMADAFPGAHRGEKIPIPLAAMPSTRRNDFIFALEGIDSPSVKTFIKDPDTEIHNFFKRIMARNFRTVDVLTANGIGFLIVAHVGISVLIIQNTEALLPKYYEHAYLMATPKSALKYKSIPLKIEVNGEVIEGSHLMACICNGRYFGNGLSLAPNTVPDDGVFTLCRLNGRSRLRTLYLFIRLSATQSFQSSNVSCIDASELKLTAPEGFFSLDGNLYPCDGSIEIKTLPRILDVFV